MDKFFKVIVYEENDLLFSVDCTCLYDHFNDKYIGSLSEYEKFIALTHGEESILSIANKVCWFDENSGRRTEVIELDI